MRAIKLSLGARAHHAIGLMSGTSHDGITATLVRIDERRHRQVKLVASKTYPYAPGFRSRLLKASAGASVGAGEISALNFGLGRALGFAALNLARGAAMPLERLSFIASHGHTMFHLPPRRVRRGEIPSTLQLGEASVIAALTGVPVVADFRPMDMALGGEAAPLAPLAHLRLFGDPQRGRAILNIGGIGNVTYLPPDAKPSDSRLIAFDTGPGNMLIDALASKFTNGRMKMDRDGKLAASGQVNRLLLAELMRMPYFSRKPPKSTGREEFGSAYLEKIERRARTLKVTRPDLIATITALTARSIAESCRKFLMPLGPVDQLIVTGGGAHNPTLMRMIAEELPGVEVRGAGSLGVDGDALEAIAFAILGYEMLRGRPGNLPSVTGARAPAILGKLTPAPPSLRARAIKSYDFSGLLSNLL